jgi:hypothetical protein
LIDVADETQVPHELEAWQSFRGEELCLHAGETSIPAVLVTQRPEDHSIGAAHWVRFHLEWNARRPLADLRLRAHAAVRLPGYQHDSAPLSAEVRRSLLEDLELSDRDELA